MFRPVVTAGVSLTLLLSLFACSSDSDGQADSGVVDGSQVDGSQVDGPAPGDGPQADTAPDPDGSGADAAVVPGGVGRACKDDSQCEPGDVCLNETKKVTLPGGYCTRPCGGDDAVCGGDAICGEIGGGVLCVQTCAKDGDCSAGYACEAAWRGFTPPAGTTVCTPGDRAAKLGDPCADDSDCAPGSGLCIINAKDGYCSAWCDPAVADSCGAGGECVPRNEGGLCAKTCADDGECRGGVGYACVAVFDGVETQGTVCAPGTKGAAIGDACGSASDCAPGTGGCVDEAHNGLSGGYCTTRCDGATGPDPCGAGAECLALPGGISLCIDGCGGDDGCRTGYACVDAFVNVAATGTVCAPGQVGTDVAIGANCAAGDCMAGSQICLPDSPFFSTPGGYCSAYCSIQDGLACPAGGTCVGDQQAGYCYATCASDADCAALRAPGSDGAYACVRRLYNGRVVEGGGKVCSPHTPAAEIGDPCQDGSGCTGELGRCIFDNNPAAPAPRFAGGYCTMDCDPAATSDTCGAGAICHAVSKGSVLGGSCVKTCQADGECRTAEGYTCQASSKGDSACLP